LSGASKSAEFATDISGKPSGLTDNSVNRLENNPAFILTESQDDVRNWAEQYRADPPLQLKFVLLSSAAASTTAQTYAAANSTNIIGPLVGLRDAIVYQAAREPADARTNARIAQRWQSITLATLGTALIVVIGLVFNLMRDLRRRTRR